MFMINIFIYKPQELHTYHKGHSFLIYLAIVCPKLQSVLLYNCDILEWWYCLFSVQGSLQWKNDLGLYVCTLLCKYVCLDFGISSWRFTNSLQMLICTLLHNISLTPCINQLNGGLIFTKLLFISSWTISWVVL